MKFILTRNYNNIGGQFAIDDGNTDKNSIAFHLYERQKTIV